MSGNKPNNSQKKSNFNKPKIATLHNMSDRNSDDEEEGQAFYAGGSERSGQQVLGPPKRNQDFRNQLAEMLRMAHASGAVIDPSEIQSTSRSTSVYQGPGLRLGATEDDHSVVAGSTNDRPSRPQNIEPIILKLWNRGFSVNDGDLRPYEDPDNREFLETVLRGEIPNELRQMGNSMVTVDIEDHKHEDFKKPATKSKSFKGSGHTLGSPAPNVESGGPALPLQQPPVVSTGSKSNEDNEKKAKETIGLQADQPTTMLQVRLPDGSRVSGSFNLTHTIDDIRRYIITARPQYEFQSFILVTAFPTKELSDGSQTIQQAGLSNASLMLRLK